VNRSKLPRIGTHARSAASEPLFARAATEGTLQLRRGQSIPLDWISASEVLRVEQGMLAMQSPRDGGGRRTALLLLPRDVFSRDAVWPVDATNLTAATHVVIRRSSLESGSAVALAAGSARLVARLATQALMLRELTAEQRLASFLVELALCGGYRTPAGCAFELPFSRADMASYLALNPDTMSRLISRLKARRLLTTPSRGLVTVPSLSDLAVLTPLAFALRRLWPAAECGALLDREPAPVPSQ